MVQAVNQRGRSPRSPSGHPHARRYFRCSFLGSLGLPSLSVIAVNHCATIRVNTMTANTDLKRAVSLVCPFAVEERQGANTCQYVSKLLYMIFSLLNGT